LCHYARERLCFYSLYFYLFTSEQHFLLGFKYMVRSYFILYSEDVISLSPSLHSATEKSTFYPPHLLFIFLFIFHFLKYHYDGCRCEFSFYAVLDLLVFLDLKLEVIYVSKVFITPSSIVIASFSFCSSFLRL
jgi:hypothetical protein